MAADGVVKFWDPVNAVEVLSLRGHATFDTTLAISPDGNRCVVGGWDGFIRMWSIDDPHAEPAEVRLQRRTVWHRNQAMDGFNTKRWHVSAHHNGQLIELDKNNWLNYTRRGWAYAELGEWDQAAADFDKASSLPNSQTSVLNNRADIYLREGDLEGYRASAGRRQAIRLDYRRGRNQLAPLALHSPSVGCGHGQRTPAVRQGGSRPSHAKSAGKSVEHGAHVSFRAGELDEAIKLFHESIKVQGKGGYFEDWAFLAMAYQKQGHGDKAKEYFDRVSEAIKTLDTGTKTTGGRVINWRLRFELTLLAAEAKAMRDEGKK